MKRYALVHQIFEDDETEPVLEHRFFGKTKKEAMAIFRAHMKTDSFLRGCQTRGRFSNFTCHVNVFWEMR